MKRINNNFIEDYNIQNINEIYIIKLNSERYKGNYE